jgi:uncharacterized protein
VNPATDEGTNDVEDAGLVEVLDRDTCLELARTVDVGRVAWAEADAPVEVLPVNFAFDGDDVIVRTGFGRLLEAVRAGHRLTFQVDDLEQVVRGGWTVLITGTAEVVEPGHDAERLGALVRPWAPGPRPVVVRLRAEGTSGRRLLPHEGGVAIVRVQ